MDEPPKLIRGRVCPVTGNRQTETSMLHIAWNVIIRQSPSTNNPGKAVPQPPENYNSAEEDTQIEEQYGNGSDQSVLFDDKGVSEIGVGVWQVGALRTVSGTFPSNPPEAIAIRACSCCRLSSSFCISVCSVWLTSVPMPVG